MNTTIDTVGGMPFMGGNMGCYDGNQWFWLIILFLFVFMGRGNMFGNTAAVDANGAMTRAAVNEGFQFNQIDNGIRGLERGQCNLGYTMLEQTNGTNMILKDGFYGNQFTAMNGFNQIGNAIAENRFASQQCCCETNRNIDASRWEASKNTCDIVTTIRDEAAATRALITANEMQNLRDRLADKDRELLAATNQIGRDNQTNTLINTLRPCSVPAYLTCSPYESAFFGSRGCGCGNWGNSCCG